MIKKLKIENFKSLLKVDIEVSNLNIFIGLNGMGKSSLIQAMLLLRQSHIQNVLEKFLLLNDENLVSIGSAHDAICEDRDGKEIRIELTLSEEEVFFWKFDYSKIGPDTNSEIIPISDYEKKDIENIYSEPLFQKGKFQYLCAERIGPKPFYNSSNYSLIDFCELGKSGQFTIHYLWNAIKKNEKLGIDNLAHRNAVFYQNNDFDKKHPKQSFKLIDNLNAWMSEISPNVQINAEFIEKVGITVLPISYKRKNNPNTKEFRSTNVGFGITYVLPVIVGLLTAKEGDLIIIENPESHIHPRGQFMLGSLIALAANEGVQLFIETHSDHLIEGIKSIIEQKNYDFHKFKIFYFKRNLEDISTSIIDVSIRSLDSIFSFEDFYTEIGRNYHIITTKLKEITKPLIITEGKTDWKHLLIALDKLKKEGGFTDLEIEFFKYEDDLKMGDTSLQKLCLELAKIKRGRKVICVFDRDVPNIVSTMGGNNKNSFVNHGNNVYSFCIPIPSHRIGYSGICIEHYYKDDEITQVGHNGYRLFLSSEFNEKSGRHNENKMIFYGNRNKLKGKTDKFNSVIIESDVFNEDNENIALPKSNFAENIYKGVQKFESFKVTEFRKIFDIVQLIIEQES